MRQYKLGQYLRRRYDKLLGEKYSPKKIYVQSSDFDRKWHFILLILCSFRIYLPNLTPFPSLLYRFAPFSTTGTLMSAQTCLAGLFPPSNEEIWNKDVFWQPIPVHTMPRKSDYLIAIETNCPKYTHLREKYIAKSKEYHRIFTEYADHIEYWSKMSGLTFKTTYDIYKLYNILTIEKEQNKRFVNFYFHFHYNSIDLIH